MPVTADKSAPYAPPSTVLEVVSRFRDRGLPTPINKEVLARAGIAETLVPRVLQTLQALDLIDEAGLPTPTFEGIRRAPQAELNQRKIEWLNGAYADALVFVDPATADEVQVRDAFRNYNPVGQQARMVSLFMGLYADAGVGAGRSDGNSPSRPLRAPRVLSPRTRAAIATTKVNNAAAAAAARKTAPQDLPSTGLPPAIQGLLASLPQAATGWTKASRDSFYGAFGTILDFCYPIMTPEQISAATADDDDVLG